MESGYRPSSRVTGQGGPRKALNTADTYEVYSKSADAWFEGKIVERGPDSFRVEWRDGEQLYAKTVPLRDAHHCAGADQVTPLPSNPLPRPQMTVLSLNLEFNTRLFNNEDRSNIHLFKRCIQHADADVVALQEVVDYRDKARDPLLAALQESGYEEVVSTTSGTSHDGRTERAISFEGMIYGKAEPQPLIDTIRDVRRPTFVKDILQDDGNPLVNKLYVKRGLSIKSSGSILVSPAGMLSYWPETDAKREPVHLAPRFLAYVEVEVAGKSAFILNTHFVGGRFEDTDFTVATEFRRKQSEAINKWAQGKSVVLVGDFNASQDFSLSSAPHLLKYANSLPLFLKEKADLTRFANEHRLTSDSATDLATEWAISKYDKYMTQPMDSLREHGWSTTTDLKWSLKGRLPLEVTRSRPVFTFKFNTVVDHAFWRGSLMVRSIEVLWALAFAVNPAGAAKFQETDMDVSNGFTDHNALLVTIDLD
eukprot:TRINITY_DN2022_c0_g1_i2.p1 TRINITY_DN2022_c0_g1~~TRINITY_DN2022_c0_g1_i2.p1  ORF type:complete len:480 (+),score=78.48 TRINITY_DN2022_c0_g1_i2:88-1527(+)